MVFASFYPETFPARRFKSSQYQGLSTAPRGGELHLASTFFSSHHLPDGLWTSAEMKFGPTSESRPDRKFFGAKCWNFLEKGSKMAKMVVFRRFFLFSPPCLAEKFQPMYLGFFCLFLGDYPLGPAASRPNPPPPNPSMPAPLGVFPASAFSSWPAGLLVNTLKIVLLGLAGETATTRLSGLSTGSPGPLQTMPTQNTLFHPLQLAH